MVSGSHPRREGTTSSAPDHPHSMLDSGPAHVLFFEGNVFVLMVLIALIALIDLIHLIDLIGSIGD